MDGKPLHVMRAALARAALALAVAMPASAQVIAVGPEGVTHISGPVVVTPEGATPIIRPEHKAPVSSKQAAAASLLEYARGEYPKLAGQSCPDPSEDPIR